MGVEYCSSVKEIYAKYPEVKQDVSILRNWMTNQKHLPNVTDFQLIQFLHRCNNSLEATKIRIDVYFTLKNGLPEYFCSRDPLGEDIQDIVKVVQLAPLTYKSPEGYTYLFTRLCDPDLTVFNLNAAAKLFAMIIDSTLRFSAMPPGFVVICDMTDFTFAHLIKISPTMLIKMFMYVQDAMPVKLKAMHVINATTIINSIIAFTKPLLKKRLSLQRLHFHGGEQGMKEFYKSVPQKSLPKDYGGDDDSINNLFEKAQRGLAANREWFLEDEQRCKIDESKREGHNKNCDDIFGQNGSFKKIIID